MNMTIICGARMASLKNHKGYEQLTYWLLRFWHKIQACISPQILGLFRRRGKKKKKNLLATKILAKNISMYQSLNLKFVQENKIKKRKKKNSTWPISTARSTPKIIILTNMNIATNKTQIFSKSKLLIYIYIYKTEAFEDPTIFHVSIIFK